MSAQQRFITVFLCLLICALFSCKKFEANPHAVHVNDLPEDLNNLNLARLAPESDGRDTIQFVLCGDSQRFYEQLQDLVKKTNTFPNLDFLIVAGDITDFGLSREFRWICDELQKLKVPYLCVVGNHDLQSNGEQLYRQVFGPLDFSFRFKGCRFICHNTNGVETGFNGTAPDLNFIREQMQDTIAHTFVGVSHMPPFNEDFDPSLKQPYRELLGSEKKLILSAHGHLHAKVDSMYYDDHVRYLVTPALDDREAYLIKIFKGKIIKTVFSF